MAKFSATYLGSPGIQNGSKITPNPHLKTMRTVEKERFRKRLLAQRDESRLLTDFCTGAAPRCESEGVVDAAELAASSAETDITEEILDSESKLLDKIDRALERLDDGTYGLCEQCDGRIPLARLRAKPAATLCLSCQVEKEQRETAQRKPRRSVSVFGT